MTVQKTYPYILIVGSVIGLLASFLLALDTIELIRNPQADLPCNLNPFVSCASVANVWQSNVFGFPNPFLGIATFSMLFAIGVMLLSGGRSRKPLWLLVNLGATAAMIFVLWFFYQSVYNIGSLCLYCVVVWAVTWPIFLYTTVWNYREDHFRRHEFLSFVSRKHLLTLFAGYAIPIALILFQFRDFFLY